MWRLEMSKVFSTCTTGESSRVKEDYTGLFSNEENRIGLQLTLLVLCMALSRVFRRQTRGSGSKAHRATLTCAID